MKTLLVFFLSALSFAAPPPRGTPTCMGDCGYIDRPVGSVFQEPEVHRALAPTSEKTASPSDKTAAKKAVGQRKSSTSLTNLPSYYAGVRRPNFQAQESGVLVVKGASALPPGLKSGDVVRALLTQAIKASPSVPTPIRALILSGPARGAFFLGEARLDPELKRILLSFTAFRDRSKEVYSVHATGLSLSGQIGLEGEHHSEASAFFFAELASAAVTAMADSTVTRNQTAQGTWVQEPTIANAGKQGLVSALSKTTEGMAEKVRSAPEYTEVSGSQEIQILVQEVSKKDSPQ